MQKLMILNKISDKIVPIAQISFYGISMVQIKSLQYTYDADYSPYGEAKV